MTSFDADLVGRWFGRLRDPGHPVMPQWGVVPTEQEAAALAGGQARIQAAVQDRPPPPTPGQLTERPARMMQIYLTALAAGISGTRRVLAQSVGEEVESESGSAPGPHDVSADAGVLALATGLIAAAAALHGEIEAPAYRQGRHGVEPTAAESARLAGLTAADLVVNGTGLHRIAGAAAGAAMNGWQVGLPDDPVERVEYRTRGLVAILLVALERETREPEPPGRPASCGALPGENHGRPFLAEITFTMGLAEAEAHSLSEDLFDLASEVTVWPVSNEWQHFHVHTDRPGEVIGQVYAYGTPFDLLISNRG